MAATSPTPVQESVRCTPFSKAARVGVMVVEVFAQVVKTGVVLQAMAAPGEVGLYLISV